MSTEPATPDPNPEEARKSSYFAGALIDGRGSLLAPTRPTELMDQDDTKSEVSIAYSVDVSLDKEFEDELDQDKESCTAQYCPRLQISFQTQIVIFMAIPIVFLVIFSIVSFVDNFSRDDFIRFHGPLLESIDDCAAQLNHERRSMSFYDVAFTENSTSELTAERRGIMASERALSDVLCNRAASEAERSLDSRIAQAYAQDMRVMLAGLALLRHRIDVNLLSSFEQRESMKENIFVVERAITYLALNEKASTVKTNLMRLKVTRGLANLLAMFRSAGTIGLVSQVRGNFSIANLAEIRVSWEGLTTYQKIARRVLANTPLAENLRQWENLPTTLMITRNWMMIGFGSSVDPLDFFGNSTSSLGSFNEIIPLIRRDILTDKTQTNLVNVEGIRLAIAISLCLTCAALIVRAQVVTSKQVDNELQRTKRLHGAVTKFVPRAFLKLMGCTSIMHIHAGDQTEVAVTMVFASITNFSTMTAGMSSDRLFKWLGDFIRRVSNVVHLHKGFVDKFMGDAIFAVFMNATESVKSSLGILSVVDQLGVEWVAKGGKQLIQVGVGAHSAVVSVGILGDNRRHTCTLISSEVNLASRLQGLTKYYGSRIILSEATLSQTPDMFDYRSLGLAKVRGQASGVKLYDVYQADSLPLKLFKKETHDEFEKAVWLQQTGSLDEARKIYSALRAQASLRKVDDRALDLKVAATKEIDEFLVK